MKIEKIHRVGKFIYVETDDKEHNRKQLDTLDLYFKVQMWIMGIGMGLIVLAPFIVWYFELYK